MWAIAGVLLGAFLLLSLLGFHLGPHSHLGGAAFGLLAAIWLGFIAAASASALLVWVLFAVDVGLSVSVGGLAWRALVLRQHPSPLRPSKVLGSDGVATSTLNPTGTVRVAGESWTAISLKGPVPAGSKVHVVGMRGIRLEVLDDQTQERREVAT